MSLKSVIGAAAVAVAAISTTPASALTVAFPGATTLSSPTYNRTLAGTPPVALSVVGTAVHYTTFSFSVDMSGSYTFLLSSGTGGFDTFLSLYSPSFIASAALTNVIVANDDLTTVNSTQSGFSSFLAAGTMYVAVLTGFSNTDVGGYTFMINGPAVTAVPEPAAWTMMIIGFGAVGGAMRRRAGIRTTVRYA